jgi:hypothetical protein
MTTREWLPLLLSDWKDYSLPVKILFVLFWPVTLLWHVAKSSSGAPTGAPTYDSDYTTYRKKDGTTVLRKKHNTKRQH